MRGIPLKGFFGHNGWAWKRKNAFSLPQLKRRKLLEPISPRHAPIVINSAEQDSSEEDVRSEQGAGISEGELLEFLVEPNADVPCATQGRGESSSYPSVVYEGNIATVKLGVGQMVVLDGCAMVEVVEGQASMLGYSFRRGTDVLVCSTSKLAEAITIEGRHASPDGKTRGSEEIKSLQDAFSCQLRFASHNLGQKAMTNEAGSGESLSFRLWDASDRGHHGMPEDGGIPLRYAPEPVENEFVGSLSSSLGKKTEQHTPDIRESGSDADDELDLASDCEDGDERDDQFQVPVEDVELAGRTDRVKKRTGCGLNTFNMKRQKSGRALGQLLFSNKFTVRLEGSC